MVIDTNLFKRQIILSLNIAFMLRHETNLYLLFGHLNYEIIEVG